MALSDWESDLTELESSSDEDYHPQPRKRGRPPGSVKEYKISDTLRPPRPTHYAAKGLYDLLIEGRIDLNPQYQRDVVWPETKQAALIDSLLRNFYIPPVIFACKRDPITQNEIRVCIDGKQRLTSIRRFFDGEIPHRDSVTGKKYWYKGAVKGKRIALSPQLAQSFKLKQIVCVEYDDISEEQEREIFQRVQLGVSLTPAERMQAISGPWPDLVRQIQSVIIGEEGFSDALEWGYSRGRDFQCLASVVYLLQGNQNIGQANQMEKWLQSDKPVPAKLRSDILETFKIFVHLAREKKYASCFQKPSRISPVEFIMTGVCIYNLRSRFSFMQLSSAIAKMREDVRAKHVDVRANKRVVKTMQDFLKKVQPSSLKCDPLEKTPAATAIKSLARSSKRKRDEEDDTGDDEPREQTVNKPLKAAKVSKKGKTGPEPKSTASKAATKQINPSGSKITVKKTTLALSNQQATVVSRSSAKELPVTNPATIDSRAPQLTTASVDTSQPRLPIVSASHTEGDVDDANSGGQDTSVNIARNSEETLPPSLSRRPMPNDSAMSNGASSESSQIPTQSISVKADPDAPSISSVFDRLAVIRKVKNSPDRVIPAGATITPTQAGSGMATPQQVIQHAPQPTAIDTASSASTIPQPTSIQQQRAPPPASNSSQTTGGQVDVAQRTSSSSPVPSGQITPAHMKSLLSRAGKASQSPERRSSTGMIAVVEGGSANTTTRDPRRRPSTSPSQTFYTPAFSSGILGKHSPQPSPSSRPNHSRLSPADTSTTAASRSSVTAPSVANPLATSPPPLSPTLPKRPDHFPPMSKAYPSDRMLAEKISPDWSADIPKGPRADRERGREWNRGEGSRGREGSKRSRWDI